MIKNRLKSLSALNLALQFVQEQKLLELLKQLLPKRLVGRFYRVQSSRRFQTSSTKKVKPKKFQTKAFFAQPVLQTRGRLTEQLKPLSEKVPQHHEQIAKKKAQK